MPAQPTTKNSSPEREMQRIAAGRRIGRLLLDEQIITLEQHEEARAMHEDRGGSITDCLLSLGYIHPEMLVEFLLSNSDKVGVDASHIDIDPELLDLLDARLAREYGVVPLDRSAGTLLLGGFAPLDSEALQAIEQAAGLHPRLVICARQDIDAVLRTHYSEQPLSSSEPMRLHSGAKMGHVGRLIRQVSSLPALPETVTRIREIMEDPASGVQDVVGVLTLDPPMAAKMLSVANSAAYGFPNRINDLTLAVSLLGLRETYGIVLSVAVADLANKMKHFDYKAFWLESMCSAAAARVVAKAAGLRTLTGVFSSALLHDIGRVVLSELQPNYAKIVPEALTGKDLVEAEIRAIGLAHPEAGYLLAQYWNLPPEISEPIRFHHVPEQADTAKPYVAIVALANVMACAPSTSFEESRSLFSDYGAALDILKLDMEVAEAMLEEFMGLRGAALEQPDES